MHFKQLNNVFVHSDHLIDGHEKVNFSWKWYVQWIEMKNQAREEQKKKSTYTMYGLSERKREGEGENQNKIATNGKYLVCFDLAKDLQK